MRIREGRDVGFNEYSIFSGTKVIVKNKLPENIDLKLLLEKVENAVPYHFVQDLDMIYIGDFPFLKEKDLNALYDNGAIYISNEQDDSDDLYDDIIHEIAHCLEETYGNDIYSDGIIEREFLQKRNKLLEILDAEGYDVHSYDFDEADYSSDFDEFLYIDVGYPKMSGLTMGLFISPYGATSLREYFANAFEEIFARKNSQFVKKVSPSVYSKIIQLVG